MRQKPPKPPLYTFTPQELEWFKRVKEQQDQKLKNEKIEDMARPLRSTDVRLGCATKRSDGMNSRAWQQKFFSKVVGQAGVERIVPYVDSFQCGLNPMDRPAGIFLLVGPTGVGKTRTVEALAEALHGHRSMLLRVDCGEFQMEHEVAKLVGSPPGYLGHRETAAAITQTKLNTLRSATSDLAIVLFDEIEKAAKTLKNMLLGILDKGTLTLGDNTRVIFERTLVFMTANTGARELDKALRGTWGFERQPPTNLDSITAASCKRDFAPEFLNRVDEIVTYSPLSAAALDKILDLLVEEVQLLLHQRSKNVVLSLSKPAREFLLNKADCSTYNARELRRVVQRYLQHGLATEIQKNGLQQYGHVQVVQRGDGLQFKTSETLPL